MRTGRLLVAVLGAPLVAVACATGTPDVGSGSDSGVQPGGADASYGAEGGTPTDGGTKKSDSGGGGGGGDSGGGGGGGTPLVTDGGDCIGDPGASMGIGYDFQCGLGLTFDGVGNPCAAGMNQCGAGECCYVDLSGQCYADFPDASTQCVTVPAM